MKEIKASLTKGASVINNESGRIGYIIGWLCGVPVSVLLLIFLLRGH